MRWGDKWRDYGLNLEKINKRARQELAQSETHMATWRSNAEEWRRICNLELHPENSSREDAAFDAGVEECVSSVMNKWVAAYPEDIFVEPTDEQFNACREALASVGLTIDKFSGSFGRHISKCIVEELSALKHQQASDSPASGESL